MGRAKKLEDELLTQPSADEIALETLAGDVRDILLSRVRNMSIPWGHLNEDEQRDVNSQMDECAKSLVRRAVALLTTAKFPTIMADVGAVKIDKGVEIKLQCAATVDNIVALANHGKGSAVLVLAEAADYFGEKAPPRVDKDQPDLNLGNGEDA